MSDSNPPPYPPPPSAPQPVAPAAPVYAWAAVVGGALGVLALIFPWYHPYVTLSGRRQDFSGVHPWQGFVFLIFAPILMIIAGVMWTQAIRGVQNVRYSRSANPLRAMAIATLIGGVISIGLAALSLPVLHSSIKFSLPDGSGNVSWNTLDKSLKANGGALHASPQLGLWFVYVGGALLIIVGILGLVTSRPAAPGANPQ